MINTSINFQLLPQMVGGLLRGPGEHGVTNLGENDEGSGRSPVLQSDN